MFQIRRLLEVLKYLLEVLKRRPSLLQLKRQASLARVLLVANLLVAPQRNPLALRLLLVLGLIPLKPRKAPVAEFHKQTALVHSNLAVLCF